MCRKDGGGELQPWFLMKKMVWFSVGICFTSSLVA